MTMAKLVLFILGLSVSVCAAMSFSALSLAHATQPNKEFTPGKLCSPSDSNFKEYRYAERIAVCARNVTHAMKVIIAKNYGVPESDWSSYEFDHLIPLSAGGSGDIENIWPQPLDEAHDKDRIEQQVYLGLKNDTITQAQGVQMIWDWIGQH